MGDNSNIAWTDASWNAVTGCSRVSPGCENCYAEALSLRFKRTPFPWTANHAKDNVQLHPDRLTLPLKWKKPRRIFVNSMSDLFHELVPDEFIDQMFAVMALTPHHTYQILTKRPERMRAYLTQITTGHAYVRERVQDLWCNTYHKPGLITWPLPNVWLGTSVEDQRRADERLSYLLRTPAAMRFLSCEPLLGPIDLWPMLASHGRCQSHGNYSPEPDSPCDPCGCWPSRSVIDWVIVGGESGPHFRPMNLEWARALRDECAEGGVAYFYKQGSGPRPEMDRLLDGRRWEEFPKPLG